MKLFHCKVIKLSITFTILASVPIGFISCAHSGDSWETKMFRDCPYVVIYAADMEASVIINKKEEIASLWNTIDPYFVRTGDFVNTGSSMSEILAAVGYPYDNSKSPNIFFVNVHADGTVSHLLNMNNRVVAPMPKYCHEALKLCRRYGLDRVGNQVKE